MGEVYRAADTRLSRHVALKIIAPEWSGDRHVRMRFEREARAISALSHPYVCTLHDIGEQGEVEFRVMEFVEGETLANRLARGPFSIHEFADFLRQPPSERRAAGGSWPIRAIVGRGSA